MEIIENGFDLQRWRKNNHLTQKELANNISYSESRITHIESNNEHISKRLFERVEKLDKHLHPQIKKDPIQERWEILKEYSDKYDTEISNIERSLSKLLYINVDKHGLDTTGKYLKFLSSELDYLARVEYVRSRDTKERKQLVNNIFTKMARQAIEYLIALHGP